MIDSIINDDFRINDNDILIGKYWGIPQIVERNFNGKIDNINIWNKV